MTFLFHHYKFQLCSSMVPLLFPLPFVVINDDGDDDNLIIIATAIITVTITINIIRDCRQDQLEWPASFCMKNSGLGHHDEGQKGTGLCCVVLLLHIVRAQPFLSFPYVSIKTPFLFTSNDTGQEWSMLFTSQSMMSKQRCTYGHPLIFVVLAQSMRYPYTRFFNLSIECKCRTMVEWSQLITFASSRVH